MPILKNKCNKACHIPGSYGSSGPTTTYPRSGSTGYTGVSFDYSGGLDLTSYKKDTASAKGIQDVVDTANPADSALLTHPLLEDTSNSACGDWWSKKSAEYKAVKQWIAEGAKNN